MRQRVTADLNAIRRQSHAAGVAEGRAELARELKGRIANDTRDAVGEVATLLHGISLGGDKHRVVITGRDALYLVLYLLAEIEIEAASEQPF